MTRTRNAAPKRTAEGSRSRVEELHRQLATGIEALQSGEGWRQMLDFTSRFHRYSLRNQILIGLAHEAAHRAGLVAPPTPTYVAGFHTWKTLGRRVDKGQRGYPILAPTPFEVRVATIGEGARTATRLLEKGEEPRPGERVEVQRRIGWKIEHVFDVSQTSGAPLPDVQRPQPLTGDAPHGLTAGLIEYATELGFPVALTGDSAKLNGADGLTNFRDSTIVVREDMQPAAIASTLAHEIGHVLLHDPTKDPATIATHRGVGEVEAESVAYIVAAAHGMDTSVDSLPYVAGWANSRTPVEVVEATAQRVVKAAHQVLTRLETIQVGDGSPPGATAAVAVRLSQTGLPWHGLSRQGMSPAAHGRVPALGLGE